MLKLKNRLYIKNKLINSLKIKKTLKFIMLKSIIHNNRILIEKRCLWFIKYNFFTKNLTKKNDICLLSSKSNSLNKKTNFNRHEFHKLCRSNKINSWVVNSW